MPTINPSLVGLEDVRQLRAILADLQKRLTKLEQATLPFTILQKGAIPGAMRAIQIGDVGLKGAMWMSLIGNQPGQSPYQAVTDLTGVIRAEWGNLAANGVSPAQYGFRANDGTGVPIFDSLGLIATVKTLGSAINFSQQSVTGTGAFQTVSGSSVSITLSRQTNILVLGSGTLLDPTVGDSGFVLSCGILGDGTFTNANGPQVFNTTSGALPVTPFASTAVTSGSHTFAMGVNQTSGKLWSMVQGFLYVFALGA